ARPGQIPAPAHRRDDRQPDAFDPRRRDPRHLGRPGSAHPDAAGQRPHRPRRRVGHPAVQQHPVTLNPARLVRFTDWAKTLPPRPLPRTVTPVAREYHLDYIARLAGANHLEFSELTAALDDTAAITLHSPPRRKPRGSGPPRARRAPAAGPDRPAVLARPPRLPARPRRVPPDAAPGLPPLHRPLRHHRAGRLLPAAAPDRLPPPPALDRPLRHQPRQPARRQPLPRGSPRPAPPPPPRPTAPSVATGGRGPRRHRHHLPRPARRHLDPGPAAADAPARPQH